MAWFICSYKVDPNDAASRYCAMDDFTVLIRSSGGAWSETEVLGNKAIVKVRAPAALLTTIAGTVGFYRLPTDNLNATVGSLTNAQRTALRNQILTMGYTQAEMDALGQFNTRTIAQVFSLAASRRLKPRFDPDTRSIVLDGPPQPCLPISVVDLVV